jgi:hypothetical protein
MHGDHRRRKRRERNIVRAQSRPRDHRVGLIITKDALWGQQKIAGMDDGFPASSYIHQRGGCDICVRIKQFSTLVSVSSYRNVSRAKAGERVKIVGRQNREEERMNGEEKKGQIKHQSTNRAAKQTMRCNSK